MSPARLDLSDEARLVDGDGATDDVAMSNRPASGDVFCVCRRPDNHRWMIACDGGCNDWYHGHCVKVTEQEGQLIDKYICEWELRVASSGIHVADMTRQVRSVRYMAREHRGDECAVYKAVTGRRVSDRMSWSEANTVAMNMELSSGGFKWPTRSRRAS